MKVLKEKGINTFQKLKDALILDSKLLNAKQKIGLQYYDDIEKRIPYVEIEDHDKYLHKIILENKKVECINIVGSYRRKKESSGDIDLLVKIKNKDDYIGILKEIVEKLKKEKYILEILACKDKKFMGIVKLKESGIIARRLDMLITYPEEYACALLYFTGSKEHNIKVRNKALKMGYTLNEHRMEKIKSDVKDIPYFNSEKDIFDFLEIEYIDPHLRD